MKFINRFSELKRLTRNPGEDTAIIYGRRRVGKTALIRKAVESTPHLFYQAVKLPAALIYKELAMEIGGQTGNRALQSGEIKDISTILEIFAETSKGWTLILDEFGYMVESDPGLPSIVQRFIDRTRGNAGLILTGSTYSIIEKLLGERSPLWGRIDTTLEIKPLSFIYTRDYWENLPFFYRAGLYGALGGIPYNWERAKIGKDLFDTLTDAFYLPGSPLYHEVYYVLREELRETRTYMAVLQAIASGRRRFSEIADVSSIPVSSLPKYLDVLKGINLVQQEIPVNEKPTSKKGLWRISDHMIQFWFKFVLPYRHMIEIEAGEKAIPLVREKWNDYMGDIYENIAMQLVWEMIKQDELPFVEKLGRWWNKEMEFDILGMNGKKVYLVGEVKWGHFSASDLDKFQQKVKRLPFDLAEDVTYVLFSGKGFQVEIPSGIIAVTGDKKHLVSTPNIRK
jgi:AAA+ ATPase superfamily predicted ATPase